MLTHTHLLNSFLSLSLTHTLHIHAQTHAHAHIRRAFADARRHTFDANMQRTWSTLARTSIGSMQAAVRSTPPGSTSVRKMQQFSPLLQRNVSIKVQMAPVRNMQMNLNTGRIFHTQQLHTNTLTYAHKAARVSRGEGAIGARTLHYQSSGYR